MVKSYLLVETFAKTDELRFAWGSYNSMTSRNNDVRIGIVGFVIGLIVFTIFGR
jgi:hypothetical protein